MEEDPIDFNEEAYWVVMVMDIPSKEKDELMATNSKRSPLFGMNNGQTRGAKKWVLSVGKSSRVLSLTKYF